MQVDYRDYAIELVEDNGFDAQAMLVAALKYMSQDDVKDMLEANEYPNRFAWAEDEEVEVDLLARYPDAIAQLDVLKRDYLGGTV